MRGEAERNAKIEGKRARGGHGGGLGKGGSNRGNKSLGAAVPLAHDGLSHKTREKTKGRRPPRVPPEKYWTATSVE